MRHQLITLAALAATLPGVAAAHDFYIALDRWSFADADAAKVKAQFRVGHPATSAPWTLRDGRNVRLETIGPLGCELRDDALIFPTAGEKSGATLDLEGDGIHVIAFETDQVFNKLDAEKFNAYLEEEGLTPAIIARRKAGAARSPGREYYSRRAKALVRVGEIESVPPRAVGQTLEITPLDNPFTLGDGEPLRVRIDYEGEPLAGATVTMESLSVGLLPETKQKTDASGLARFNFPKRGAWKINVVWTKPIENERADFETVFSSLTFGY